MMLSIEHTFIYLLLVLIISIPFYNLRREVSILNTPIRVPKSSFMIFVPMLLAILFTYITHDFDRLATLFIRIMDIHRVNVIDFMFLNLMILILNAIIYLKHKNEVYDFYINIFMILKLMAIYFLGAIPEELGWTLMITSPLSQYFGIHLAGVIIGVYWTLWHIVPWRFNHNWEWIAGMSIFSILSRVVMVGLYMSKGESLFLIIYAHMIINVWFTIFKGLNPWVMTAIFFFLILLFF